MPKTIANSSYPTNTPETDRWWQILISALLFIALSSITLAADTVSEGESLSEKQLRDKKGIERWVISHEGSNLKIFRASREIYLQDPYALLAIFEDYEAAHRWIHMLKEVKEIRRVSPQERHFLMAYRVPWPATDREAVCVGKAEQQQHDKIFEFSLKSDSSLAPPSEGKVIRVPYIDAIVKLELLENHKARITIDATVDAGGNIPDFLANMLMKDIPFYTLIKLERMLAEDKYQGKKSDFPHVQFPDSW